MVAPLKHSGVKCQKCQTEGEGTLLGFFTRGSSLNHSELTCQSQFQSHKEEWRIVTMLRY